MKPISELNISPWPWEDRSFAGVWDKHEDFIVDDEGFFNNSHDTALIAAAPELYSELWKVCFGHSKTINCSKCEGDKLGNCSECTLGGARAALAKASEEWRVQ